MVESTPPPSNAGRVNNGTKIVDILVAALLNKINTYRNNNLCLPFLLNIQNGLFSVLEMFAVAAIKFPSLD